MLKYLGKKFLALFVIWFIITVLSKLLLIYLLDDSVVLAETLTESIIGALFFSSTMLFIYFLRLRKMHISFNSKKLFDTVQKRIVETETDLNEIQLTIERLFRKKASVIKDESFSVRLLSIASWSRLTVKQLSDLNGINKMEIVVRPVIFLTILDFAESQFILKKVCDALATNTSG